MLRIESQINALSRSILPTVPITIPFDPFDGFYIRLERSLWRWRDGQLMSEQKRGIVQFSVVRGDWTTFSPLNWREGAGPKRRGAINRYQ